MAAGTDDPTAALPQRMQEVGDKMMRAARSFAQLTNFDGPPPGTASNDPAVGGVMYERFKEFDRTYLQPVFGKEDEGGSTDLPPPAEAEPPLDTP
jgi:hypothetical protein